MKLTKTRKLLSHFRKEEIYKRDKFRTPEKTFEEVEKEISDLEAERIFYRYSAIFFFSLFIVVLVYQMVNLLKE
jgi:hypothetical protein